MLYLSRRIDFSAMHSYRLKEWSEEKNIATFGVCSNPNGHGHDYKLEVMVKGSLNDRTGIVINTTEVKDIVSEFVSKELDGKYLNRENPYFTVHVPTTENIIQYLWSSLESKFEGCSLHRVRLYENHYLFSEKEAISMVRLTRKYHFCAAHRLHSEHLTRDENIRLFGKCNNEYGHGHNYYLDVTIEGDPDPLTGMIINLKELDQIVESIVLDKVDHKHLNRDTLEFQDLNPTSEVAAKVFYEMLLPHLPNLYKIGLWETEKNYFEYLGERENSA
jgi:6-pyruvoyltetrahydropterin/6-carboxytetrahydropterin synthase